MLSSLIPLLLAASAAPQDPALSAEEPLAGHLGARAITVEEYQQFLWQRFGRRALRQYADLLLLRQTAEDFGVAPAEQEIRASVEERIAAMRADSSAAEFELQLQRSDMDLAGLQASLRLETEQDLLASRLVLETRIATDAALQEAFVTQYGQDGIQVVVAHLLVMPNFLRAEKLRAGATPAEIDLEALKQESRERAEQALAQLREGAAFEDLVEQYSHDQSTRDQQGQLAAWRPGLYGEAFTAAVQATAAGEAADRVVESGAGFHIVRVLERRTTVFADVRAELVTAYLAGPATWQEKEQLLVGLRARTPLEFD